MGKSTSPQSFLAVLMGLGSGRRIAAIGLIVSIVVCLSGWSAFECFSLRQEQQAKAILERDYNGIVIAEIFSNSPDRTFDDQRLDIREIRRCRLFVPVTRVTIHHATIGHPVCSQLACFRSLESLTFQDCRFDPSAELPSAPFGCLKALAFWRTPIRTEILCRLGQLTRLEELILDGTGLKGDWLQHVSRLPKLRSLVLNDGDLSDGETNSLSRMKGLTSLQLSGVKIDSRLGAVIARLEKLDGLAIRNSPFDDEGMKHLAGLNRLRILILGGTAITDDGMRSLEGLVNLWRVSLCSTKVGDTGLSHLSRLPRLSGLDIRGTRATNSCLRLLAALPSLKVTLVGGTSISTSSPGFVGVLHDGVWYPNEARAKEAEEN